MTPEEEYYSLRIKELRKTSWGKPSTLLTIVGLLFSVSIATYEKINGIELSERLDSYTSNIESKDDEISKLIEESQLKERQLVSLRERPSNNSSQSQAITQLVELPTKSVKLKAEITEAGRTRWLRKQKYYVKLTLESSNNQFNIADIDSVTYLLDGFSGENPTIIDSPKFARIVTAFKSFSVTVAFRYQGTTYQMNEYVDINL